MAVAAGTGTFIDRAYKAAVLALLVFLTVLFVVVGIYVWRAVSYAQERAAYWEGKAGQMVEMVDNQVKPTLAKIEGLVENANKIMGGLQGNVGELQGRIGGLAGILGGFQRDLTEVKTLTESTKALSENTATQMRSMSEGMRSLAAPAVDGARSLGGSAVDGARNLGSGAAERARQFLPGGSTNGTPATTPTPEPIR